MKILCRDVVIQGTTATLSTATALGPQTGFSAVHMALGRGTPSQQVGCHVVHNPQHYNYSL
jgi:hypothetical protein